MKISPKIALALGVLATATLGAVSTASAADPAYVTTNLNLRAGPGFDYPTVVTMRAGDGVTVYGCLSGYSWCDIDWRGNRGWAAGQYLQVMYQSHRRPITSYGAYLGLPFITFSLDSYWGDHYRGRKFFGQMPRFEGHKPPPMGGQPPFNGNPPPNKPPKDHTMTPGSNGPTVGNGPQDNGNKPPKDNYKPNGSNGPTGNGPQGNGPNGNGPTGKGPQGNGPKGPQGNGPQGGGNGCPPNQKMVDGACK